MTKDIHEKKRLELSRKETHDKVTHYMALSLNEYKNAETLPDDHILKKGYEQLGVVYKSMALDAFQDYIYLRDETYKLEAKELSS